MLLHDHPPSARPSHFNSTHQRHSNILLNVFYFFLNLRRFFSGGGTISSIPAARTSSHSSPLSSCLSLSHQWMSCICFWFWTPASHRPMFFLQSLFVVHSDPWRSFLFCCHVKHCSWMLLLPSWIFVLFFIAWVLRITRGPEIYPT